MTGVLDWQSRLARRGTLPELARMQKQASSRRDGSILGTHAWQAAGGGLTCLVSCTRMRRRVAPSAELDSLSRSCSGRPAAGQAGAGWQASSRVGNSGQAGPTTRRSRQGRTQRAAHRSEFGRLAGKVGQLVRHRLHLLVKPAGGRAREGEGCRRSEGQPGSRGKRRTARPSRRHTSRRLRVGADHGRPEQPL